MTAGDDSCIGCSSGEVCFTGSASEANNTVLQGLAELFFPGKKKIVSTPIEHASIAATLEHLRRRGLTVEFVPVDRAGRVIMSRLEELVDDDTFLVCCALANNEIGTVQDVAAVAAVAHERGALVLSDCVQALGKIPGRSQLALTEHPGEEVIGPSRKLPVVPKAVGEVGDGLDAVGASGGDEGHHAVANKRRSQFLSGPRYSAESFRLLRRSWRAWRRPNASAVCPLERHSAARLLHVSGGGAAAFEFPPSLFRLGSPSW